MSIYLMKLWDQQEKFYKVGISDNIVSRCNFIRETYDCLDSVELLFLEDHLQEQEAKKVGCSLGTYKIVLNLEEYSNYELKTLIRAMSEELKGRGEGTK